MGKIDVNDLDDAQVAAPFGKFLVVSPKPKLHP